MASIPPLNLPEIPNGGFATYIYTKYILNSLYSYIYSYTGIYLCKYTAVRVSDFSGFLVPVIFIVLFLAEWTGRGRKIISAVDGSTPKYTNSEIFDL